MIEKIIFFNNYHNGDLHYGREFIKYFSKLFKQSKCFVAHNKCESLLKDTELELIRLNLNQFFKQSHFVINSTLFFNFWIGQKIADEEWEKNNNITGACTLNKNYKIFKKKAELFGFELLTEHEYIPSIDYNRYGIDSLKFDGNNIFISNGSVLSGQSLNFDMTDTINKLAETNKHCNFYVTEKISSNFENIIDANSLFQIEYGCSNLIQLSRLSNFCKIIIGRGSGPFCFAHVKENLFDQNKTFIGIGNDSREIHWATMTDYDVASRAKQVWIGDYKNVEKDLYNAINEEINEKFGNR